MAIVERMLSWEYNDNKDRIATTIFGRTVIRCNAVSPFWTCKNIPDIDISGDNLETVKAIIKCYHDLATQNVTPLEVFDGQSRRIHCN